MENLKNLAKKLVDALAEKGKTIATAESCTGGMIGECITSVPGSSSVYGYGFITYSNEAKQKLLGVKKETLEACGAVSGETVCEMAEGAINISGADISVSVSGIAGPGGGTKEKPIGTVYVGIKEKGKDAIYKKLSLDGDRESIRKKTAETVFNIILNLL